MERPKEETSGVSSNIEWVDQGKRERLRAVKKNPKTKVTELWG